MGIMERQILLDDIQDIETISSKLNQNIKRLSELKPKTFVEKEIFEILNDMAKNQHRIAAAYLRLARYALDLNRRINASKKTSGRNGGANNRKLKE